LRVPSFAHFLRIDHACLQSPFTETKSSRSEVIQTRPPLTHHPSIDPPSRRLAANPTCLLLGYNPNPSTAILRSRGQGLVIIGEIQCGDGAPVAAQRPGGLTIAAAEAVEEVAKQVPWVVVCRCFGDGDVVVGETGGDKPPIGRECNPVHCAGHGYVPDQPASPVRRNSPDPNGAVGGPRGERATISRPSQPSSAGKADEQGGRMAIPEPLDRHRAVWRQGSAMPLVRCRCVVATEESAFFLRVGKAVTACHRIPDNTLLVVRDAQEHAPRAW